MLYQYGNLFLCECELTSVVASVIMSQSTLVLLSPWCVFVFLVANRLVDISCCSFFYRFVFVLLFPPLCVCVSLSLSASVKASERQISLERGRRFSVWLMLPALPVGSWLCVVP